MAPTSAACKWPSRGASTTCIWVTSGLPHQPLLTVFIDLLDYAFRVLALVEAQDGGVHSRAAASNIWVRPAPFTYSVAYMLTIRSMARRHIAQNFSYRVNMMQFSCGR